MNICMFAKGLPVHVMGGMELHVEHLTKGLIEKGHQITIITTKHPQNLKKETRKNLEIYYVGDKPLWYSKKFCKESADLFKKLDKERKFDVVHSQSVAAYGYVKYCEKTSPLVITIHGTALTEIRGALKSHLAKPLLMIPVWLKRYFFDDSPFFKKADMIITVNQMLHEHIQEKYSVPEKRISTIYNGVDTERFRPGLETGKLREKLGIKNKNILLSAGRIDKQKGYHLLLGTLQDLEKNIALIVGDGPYLEELKKISKQLNAEDRAIFTGSVPNQEMPFFYNLSDIFCFQSLISEGMPSTILEAMACGKPIIAAKTGGVPEVIIDGETGLLFKQGDVEELRKKLHMLLENKKLRDKFGRNARKLSVQKFSLDKMIRDTIKVYKKVGDQ